MNLITNSKLKRTGHATWNDLFAKAFADIHGFEPVLPIVYALLIEAAELGLFAFAALLTLEAIIPGIVSVRLNLAIPFMAILLLIALAAALGRKIGVSFPFLPDKKSPLTRIGISWLAFLLTLSSIHFPFWAVPIIVGGLFLSAHFFWRLLFRGE
ncbi:MAG TPA: hypothetical protein VN420_05405 [Candidatus Fimivivens sp.]|nr:hypothetical protein [Candidatus Fimivivens sp.]